MANLFDDIRDGLKDFDEFLEENGPIVKNAVGPLDQLTGGRVTELINKLVALLQDLKKEVEDLNPGIVENLDKVTDFTKSVKSLLETSKSLLPDETATIDDIIGVADIVTGLPSIDDIKGEITGLIDSVIVHLNNLKS